MEGIGWLMAIILGGIAGWIAEQIMKSNMGLIANIVCGIVGALLLNFILRAVGIIPPGGWIGQSIVAIVGACILIGIYRMIKGRSVA